MKNQGELKIYTGCAFFRDWESGVLEMNQTAYAENLVAQYGISATSNISGSPGVELGPISHGHRISLMGYARARATTTIIVPGTGRYYCRSPRT